MTSERHHGHHSCVRASVCVCVRSVARWQSLASTQGSGANRPQLKPESNSESSTFLHEVSPWAGSRVRSQLCSRTKIERVDLKRLQANVVKLAVGEMKGTLGFNYHVVSSVIRRREPFATDLVENLVIVGEPFTTFTVQDLVYMRNISRISPRSPVYTVASDKETCEVSDARLSLSKHL